VTPRRSATLTKVSSREFPRSLQASTRIKPEIRPLPFLLYPLQFGNHLTIPLLQSEVLSGAFERGEASFDLGICEIDIG
jgi:hypothetical protein